MTFFLLFTVTDYSPHFHSEIKIIHFIIFIFHWSKLVERMIKYIYIFVLIINILVAFYSCHFLGSIMPPVSVLEHTVKKSFVVL